MRISGLHAIVAALACAFAAPAMAADIYILIGNITGEAAQHPSPGHDWIHLDAIEFGQGRIGARPGFGDIPARAGGEGQLVISIGLPRWTAEMQSALCTSQPFRKILIRAPNTQPDRDVAPPHINFHVYRVHATCKSALFAGNIRTMRVTLNYNNISAEYVAPRTGGGAARSIGVG